MANSCSDRTALVTEITLWNQKEMTFRRSLESLSVRQLKAWKPIPITFNEMDTLMCAYPFVTGWKCLASGSSRCIYHHPFSLNICNDIYKSKMRRRDRGKVILSYVLVLWICCMFLDVFWIQVLRFAVAGLRNGLNQSPYSSSLLTLSSSSSLPCC